MTTEPSHEQRAAASIDRRVVLLTISVFVAFSLLAVQPALAAESDNPVCNEQSGTLTDMIEGFVQLTTGLGIMGLLVIWQADELMEMFTLNREQKASLKAHKRGAMKSGVILTVLGPVFTLAGSAMGLPIAECVNLIPF
jgi:hypothetical protein